MPESDFEILMDFVLAWEGRVFEDDPDDPGGATKYGLCLRSPETACAVRLRLADVHWRASACRQGKHKGSH